MRTRTSVLAVVSGMVLAVTGCGPDRPQVRLPADSPAAPTASTPSAALPTTTPPPATPVPTTTGASPTVTTSPATDGIADLDGDGTLDEVEIEGAAVTARLSTTGQADSVALPEDAVGTDAEVFGRSDLDADGVDEALVRTLALPNGDVRVVLRLGSGGLELLTTEDGEPFQLGSLVGMSGRRSYDCRETHARTGREVRVLDAERDGDAAGELTFTGFVTTWSVSGATAAVLGTERVSSMPADSPELDLDPSTCAR